MPALIAAVHSGGTDETARFVLADWVQEKGAEFEALAIRDRRPLVVDLLPSVLRVVKSLSGRLESLPAALESGAVPAVGNVARTLVELAAAHNLVDYLHEQICVGRSRAAGAG